MKVALLFRGPARLSLNVHKNILCQTYSTVSNLFNCKVEPFLLTYTGAATSDLEYCLDFTAITKIREISEIDLDRLGEAGLHKPLVAGGSRINAYKQYHSMHQWVRAFRGSNFGCTHIFYARTDVAFDTVSSSCWLSEDGYTTAHAKGINGAKWTCDYVGAAPISIFCDSWDFGSETHLLEAVLGAQKGEDPLDIAIKEKNIRLHAAYMRFGGHLIRTDRDYDSFWSSTSGA
jgi:hypothetical protein